MRARVRQDAELRLVCRRNGELMKRTMRESGSGPVSTGLVFAALLLSGCGCHSRLDAPRPEPGTNPPAQSTNAEHGLRVRAPAVAGLFYPADKAVLSQTIDGLLDRAPAHYLPRLKGLVCPHAGYAFSGLTAATAYKTLAGRDVQTVIVLGRAVLAFAARRRLHIRKRTPEIRACVDSTPHR